MRIVFEGAGRFGRALAQMRRWRRRGLWVMVVVAVGRVGVSAGTLRVDAIANCPLSGYALCGGFAVFEPVMQPHGRKPRSLGTMRSGMEDERLDSLTLPHPAV